MSILVVGSVAFDTLKTPYGERQKILGGAAYLLTGVTHFTSIRPARGRLSGPGLEWEGPFLVLAVGNGRLAGGGHPLCPAALLNDGLLDVRVLPELPSDEVAEALGALLHEGLDALQRYVVDGRVARFEIEADEPLQINLDGEPISDRRFRFELEPRRLRVKLPADCALLQN